MTIKTVVFPAAGKAKNLTEVKNIAADINTSLIKYCKDEGITDVQGIKLPGLSDALDVIKKFQQEVTGTRNDLAVRAGIDDKGHFAMTVNGILPRKGKPVKIDESVVIRKDFSAVVEQLKNQANAVVNLQKGDAIIDRAAERQGNKFGSAPVEPDDAEYGDITTGNIILAAHGGRSEVSGTIIGTKLGKRSAAQIVDLLTTGDKKQRLSKEFSGTVWLSGCFTASGGIAPPGADYDYESFARSVWELLKRAGYKRATVKGQPGIARTDVEGNKSSVTPTGQKDYDKLKKELIPLQAEIKTLETKLAKLKKDHPDEDELRSNRDYVTTLILLNETRKTATRLDAEKEMHVIKTLVATYGLSAR